MLRIACHGITWGRQGFLQSVQEISALGIRGFETWPFLVDEYGLARIGEFKDLLARHNLQLIALYGGGRMDDPDFFEEVVATNVRFARFLQANGADRLVLGPPRRPSGGPTRDQLLNQVHCMNEIGRRTLEYGVLACIHPHFNTAVERLEEIDFVMDRTDPRYVAMAADTAHLRKGNPEDDAAERKVFQRYAGRIKYVHLKDWDPNMPPETSGEGGTAIIKDFVELGQGVVRLKECIELLRQAGYDGWLTIELDYTRRTPTESVQMSKEYLERELGLRA
jgi:inosose dehydratase